jgi:hypothetical protein
MDQPLRCSGGELDRMDHFNLRSLLGYPRVCSFRQNGGHRAKFPVKLRLHFRLALHPITRNGVCLMSKEGALKDHTSRETVSAWPNLKDQAREDFLP